MASSENNPHHVTNNITVNAPTPESMGVLKRNWLVAILLSVFLGWLGVDRFYLGNVGLGILKFLTFGLFGILWVVDILMIATKSVRGVVWEK